MAFFFVRNAKAYRFSFSGSPDRRINLKFMLAAQKERNPRVKFTRSRTR